VIIGLGIDVVEVDRVARAISRHGARFRDRVFTLRESADCERRGRSAAHYALRFAAKEAGMKAIGTGWGQGVTWCDFETIEGTCGLEFALHGRALELARSHGFERAWIGASWTRSHALAQVALEGRRPSPR